jgi:hypothetical protein
MNRIIAAGLAAMLAAVLAGCGKKDSSKELPPASELFDKKEVPKRWKGPGGKADPG